MYSSSILPPPLPYPSHAFFLTTFPPFLLPPSISPTPKLLLFFSFVPTSPFLQDSTQGASWKGQAGVAYRGRPQHEGASTGELLPQAPATAAAEGGEAAQAAGEEGEGVGGISTEATQEGGNGSKVGILLHIHTTHTHTHTCNEGDVG